MSHERNDNDVSLTVGTRVPVLYSNKDSQANPYLYTTVGFRAPREQRRSSKALLAKVSNTLCLPARAFVRQLAELSRHLSHWPHDVGQRVQKYLAHFPALYPASLSGRSSSCPLPMVSKGSSIAHAYFQNSIRPRNIPAVSANPRRLTCLCSLQVSGEKTSP